MDPGVVSWAYVLARIDRQVAADAVPFVLRLDLWHSRVFIGKLRRRRHLTQNIFADSALVGKKSVLTKAVFIQFNL